MGYQKYPSRMACSLRSALVTANHSLQKLTSCVSHVLQHRLLIDISVFCDFLEGLASRIAIQYKTVHGVLHDLMLPRTWLLSSLRHEEQLGPKTRFYALAETLVQNAATLLQSIHDPENFHGKCPLKRHFPYVTDAILYARLAFICWPVSHQARLLHSPDVLCSRLQALSASSVDFPMPENGHLIITPVGFNAWPALQDLVTSCFISLRRAEMSAFHPSCVA
jgi:hypothetical protein